MFYVGVKLGQKGKAYTDNLRERGPDRDMAPKGEEVTGGWRKLNDEEITWFLVHIKYYKAISRGWCVGGECGTNERKEMHTEFWWENVMEENA